MLFFFSSSTMKLLWALGLVCLSILVDVGAQTKVDLTYIKGAAAKGAFCLDGSVPAYHLDRGYGSGANNWVIHLQGGGWCTTKEACVNRMRGDLGSSKQLQPITFTGILSNKSEENPDFFNWNRVFVRYCDGACFSGDSQDEASGLYFRGQRVWLVAMEALMSQGMRNAKQALLTGCSAGGLATIIHCDEFLELFPNITTVKCLSDAGLFLDVTDISGGRFLRDDFEAVVSLQGVQKNLPHSCTAKKDPTSCFFPQNLIDNIRTPLFLVNPLYDAWQVNNALIPISADPQGKWNACKSYYANCSSSQKQILEDFGNQMVNAVSSFSRSKKNGLYMNSCFAHCETDAEGPQSNWFFPNSPRIGNMSIAESVGDWYFDRVTANVHIDQPKPFGTNCHNEGFKALAPNSPI